MCQLPRFKMESNDYDCTFVRDNSKGSSNSYCSVPQCQNRARPGISFHKFPREMSLRSKWVNVLKIGKTVSKCMCVCSEHFKPEDFFYFAPTSKIRRLKKTSVPSCKLPNRTHDRIPTEHQVNVRAARHSRAERRRQVEEIKNIQSLCEENCHQEPNVTLQVDLDSQGDTGESSEAAVQQREITAAEALMELHTSLQKEEKICEENVEVLCDGLVADKQEMFVSSGPVNLLTMIKNDADLTAFTGIPTLRLLKSLTDDAEVLQSTRNGAKKLQLDLTERIVLTMVKIKLNISFTCLSILFGISITTCIRYFHLTVELLSSVLTNAIIWPEKEDILRNMPICFKKYKETRVILDCTETPVEKPACLKCRLSTYSHYKGRNTIKYLIGVAPEGLITFVSKAYGGRASDKAIYLQSGLMSQLIPYCDAIMSDKGFLVEHECAINGIKLIRPPFLGKSKQFSAAQGQATADIAQARVHVERSIQRIKVFKILKGDLPWNMVSCIDHIITIVCGIVNLSKPILALDKF